MGTAFVAYITTTRGEPSSSLPNTLCQSPDTRLTGAGNPCPHTATGTPKSRHQATNPLYPIPYQSTPPHLNHHFLQTADLMKASVTIPWKRSRPHLLAIWMMWKTRKSRTVNSSVHTVGHKELALPSLCQVSGGICPCHVTDREVILTLPQDPPQSG